MSEVTNILISTEFEEDGQLIADWLRAMYGGIYLLDVWQTQECWDENTTEVRCYGGDKALEANVRIGAFDHFDTKLFYSAVADLSLKGEVKIFVQKQHENVLTLGLSLP